MKHGERRKRGVKTAQQLLIMLQYLRLIKKQKNYRLCNLKALSLADFIRILIMFRNIVARPGVKIQCCYCRKAINIRDALWTLSAFD
jgi:hypothetical protein